MYAIVDIAGQQFKVEKDQKIFVHRLDGDEGSKVDFDQVLLVDNDGKVQVGTPLVKNTIVTASIVSHLKGDTVKVFKKKRRKGYQVLNGHRQAFTEILIERIGEGVAKAAPAKKAEAPAAKAKPAEKKVEPAAKTETKAKPAAEKKATATKEAAKPSAEKKATATKAAAKPAAAKPKAAAAAKKPAAKKPAAKAASAKKPAAKAAAPKAKKADEKKTDK